MSEITPLYIHRAEWWMLVTMLAYFLMNGAQLFETFVLVPKWTADAPRSLGVLQGPFAPDLKTFWIIAHSIHELTFIAAIFFCWRIPEVRNLLLLLFALHFAVRLWTLGFFAPQIMGFQKADLQEVSDSIRSAVAKWHQLNYVRVAIFLLVSAGIVFVYSKVRDLHPHIASAIK
ncbi:MAG: transposase [Chitinophagaceae bacterium]|nr:MAG: transposase [Chitinophagaceae bacterium]